MPSFRPPFLSLFALMVLAPLLAPGSVQADPAGFAFLEVPSGARGSALGGAYGTIADGVESAFWNPAGLAAVAGLQITGSHYEFVQSLRHEQFAIGGKLLGGGISAALRAMYSEPITARDAEGNEIGTFGGHDLEFLIGYGRELASGLRAGGSAQLVRERIADDAVTAYGFGGGVTWVPEAWPAWRLGLSAHNLGPDATYKIDGERGQPVHMPMALQGGGSYGVMAGGLDVRGALEARLTRGRSMIAMVGAEVSHPSGAALRAGFRANDDATSFSMGAGYAKRALHLDYAFVPMRLDLGDTHRVSFSTQF